MQKYLIKLIIVNCFIFAALFFSQNVYAETQIYPYNSGSGPAYYYYLQRTTGQDGFTDCYDSEPIRTYNMFVNESDNIQTYTQTGGAFQQGGGNSCLRTNWNSLPDNTRNHPDAATTYANQIFKVPANITKITHAKYYTVDTGGQTATIKLVLSSVTNYPSSPSFSFLQQTNEISISSGGVADFNNLNWSVTPGQWYVLGLSRTNAGYIALPVTSPCSPAECHYFINWGGIQDVQPNSGYHSETDAYLDGYATSGSSYFDYISKAGGIRKADLARVAFWGDGWIPPSCSGTTTFNGCIKVGGTRCLDWGSPSWPNWDSSKWNQCNTACNLPNPDYYCAQCSLSASPTSIVTPNSINYSLSVSPAASTAYWNVTKNGAASAQQIGSTQFPAGSTARNFSDSYTSVDAGSYTRYVTFKDNIGNLMCTTNTVAIDIAVPVSPPTITSLQIGNTTTRSFSGTYGTSGNQSTQGGSNWLNPLLITLNINAGSSTSPQSYVAFYSRSSMFTNRATVIDDIKTYLTTTGNKDKGFLLAYGSGIKAGDIGNNHYVFDPNAVNPNLKWIKLLTTGDTDIYNESGSRLYSVKVGSDGVRSWQVTFNTNVGYKDFYTMGYLVDGVQSSLYDFQPNASPSPGPY